MLSAVTNRELAQRAFDAFRRGVGGEQAGVEEFVGYLADDAVCLFPPLPHMPSRYEGPAAARGIFAGVLSRIPRGLHFEPVFVLEDGERFAFQFADRGERADGSWYRNSVTITLEVRDGKVRRLWEFLGGPGYYVADGVEP
jgi:ketosteroid isomerase-like protein